jgi:hypothetical protein
LATREAGTLTAIKALSARDEAIAPHRSALRKVNALVQVLSQLMERDLAALSPTTQWSWQCRKSSPQSS